MSYFKKDKSELLALERVEKLVSALYLVTGLLGEKEPIRAKLREESLALLSLCAENTQESEKDKGRIVAEVVASLERVQSLLFVAKASGTISLMNADLLIRGFLSLKHFFDARESSLFEVLNVPETHIENMVSVPEMRARDYVDGASREESKEESKVSTRGEDRRGERTLLEVSGRESVVETVLKESEMSSAPKVWMSRTVSEAPRGVFKARKVSRREQILGVFVKGRDISIKDISAKVKGCSEKTIQRELNNLVFDHLLSRIGEKRWSRYVLR